MSRILLRPLHHRRGWSLTCPYSIQPKGIKIEVAGWNVFYEYRKQSLLSCKGAPFHMPYGMGRAAFPMLKEKDPSLMLRLKRTKKTSSLSWFYLN